MKTGQRTLTRKELSHLTQEHELALTKLLNTETISGKVNSFAGRSETPISFNSYTSGDFSAETNPYQYMLVSALKN